MSRTVQGVLVLILSGLGMFFGLIGPEIRAMQDWSPVTTPAFVGEVLVQLGVVLGAFVAGQLIPGMETVKRVSGSMGNPDA